MTNLLIADDDKAVRQVIKLVLTGEPFDIREAGSIDDAYASLKAELPDLMLLDIHFSGGATSLPLLERLQREGLEIPIIILSGEASASEAVQAIRLGAYDFIEKPVSADRLKISITNCLNYHHINRLFQDATTSRSQYNLIGESDSIVEIRQTLAKIASRDVKVLITGETGVGKEVVAQGVWQASPRRDKPFIIVNAAAIPDSLIESEVFGHKKGSFTGASRDQAGKIEMADGGTLFIDEIGDLPQNAQTKLLRFLETGEVQKVGASHSRRVDVRVITATSKDIEREVAQNQFRKDLYFRINVARIHVPPLRSRPQDIVLLFKHFIDGFSRKMGLTVPLIAADVEKVLLAHRWPGNVRELRNLAESLLIGDPNGINAADVKRVLQYYALIETDSTFLPDEESQVDSKHSPESIVVPLSGKFSLKEYRQVSERLYIQKVLSGTGGSIKEAAKWLDIDRSYLHQKMAALGIQKAFENE